MTSAHIISARSARQSLVLGRATVADGPNEIVAIPKLLGRLTIKGATVTIYAMGFQREIAEKTPTRSECGLPAAGFVFCCFNNIISIYGFNSILNINYPNTSIYLLFKI